MPARVVVNADDEFTYDHSVRERDCTPVAFEFAVDHKPGQPGIAPTSRICVPHKSFTSLNFNLFPDRSHTRFHLQQCVITILLTAEHCRSRVRLNFPTLPVATTQQLRSQPRSSRGRSVVYSGKFLLRDRNSHQPKSSCRPKHKP